MEVKEKQLSDLIYKKMKAYKIQLSNKSEIQADDDEIQNILKGIQSGQPVMLRQGIFNPSFFVAIIRDVDRIKRFREDLLAINKHNYHDKEYDGGKDQRSLPAPQLLADIFKEMPLKLKK